MPPTPKGHRAREIFENALELPSPAAQADYVQQACGTDAILRARVEKLLCLHRPAESLLPDAPDHFEQVVVPTELPGDQIGRYKLLRRLGEGGCGVVYLAEQEEPVRRQVALKIIKLGMDTKSVVSRFEAERQALAMMDHPHIARVFDGGATATGRPFFVMELVSGLRITDYCQTNGLSTRARLDLFLKVCHAVQHAHQKGVIHRDLKPSNILVACHEGALVPKVIDFGIAKATEVRLTENTISTHDQMFLGTPAYMSPEQAQFGGSNIDTRADIYSLGVLLYELLTGTTPFDPQELLKAGFDEMRRLIRDSDPPTPSRRVKRLQEKESERGKLVPDAVQTRTISASERQRLATDLDWIVMKCLEKDRGRRYATANDLALDVQRHLNDEPVEARPPSRRYRLLKLVRRNRATFVALAAIALLLMAGVAVSSWQAVRARRAEREARQQAYASDMKSASAAVAAEDFGQAVDLLQRYVPDRKKPDLRGLEWRYLWHATRGDELRSLDQDRWINCARLSPDGMKLACALFGGETRIVDATTGRPVVRFPGTGDRSAACESLAFSPDGKLFASGSESGVTVRETEHWQKLQEWPAGTVVAFSPDGKTFARVDDAGTHLYASNGWRLRGVLPARVRGAPRIAFSPDSRRLAIVRREQPGVELWNLEQFQLIGQLDEFPLPLSVAYSPDGRWLAAGNSVGELRVWDAREQKLITTEKAHARYLLALSFSADGSLLATGGGDQLIQLWRVDSTGPALLTKQATLRGHRNDIWSLCFTPNGAQLLSAGRDGMAKFWDPKAQARDSTILNTGQHGFTLGFLPEGKLFVTYDEGSKQLQIWNTVTGFLTKSIPVNAQGALVLSGRNLCFGVTNGIVETWSLPGGECNKRLALPGGSWGAVRLSADQKLFLGWNKPRGEVKLWDLKTEQSIAQLPDFAVPELSPEWSITQLAAFSPEGRYLAYASTNYTVKVWDQRRRQAAFSLSGHTWHIQCLRFSPDGKHLITGSWDGLARVWDTTTGRETLPPLKHQTGIGTVSFSADGRTLLTRGGDDLLHFWSASSGAETLTVPNATAWYFDIISADGNTLAWEMGYTGRYRIHHLPTLSEIDSSIAQKIR